MKTNNIIAPYETIDKHVSFSFTFQHSSTEPFQQLFEKIYNVSNEKLEEIIKPMCERPFDPSNFVHLKDEPLTPSLGAFILGPFPLVKKAGCVIVTRERLYFQPFEGVYSEIAAKALSWSIGDIVAIARRYHGLKDETVEIFFQEGPSVLLAFEGYKNREEVIRLIPQNRIMEGALGRVNIPVFCHTDKSFLNMVVTAWRRSEIDNFEYLLALNSAAGRSLFDLSRYPIFPWVLADYESSKLNLSGGDNGTASKPFRDLSKPIGALNEERLASFKDRWKGMEDMGDSFLYGTHYSAPGYCLYYLVRTMPEHMLCLQNGMFW
jgi:factor associated with neutral sphingomyelinase activation